MKFPVKFCCVFFVIFFLSFININACNIAGNYGFATIKQRGRTFTGSWRERRPDFYGTVDSECNITATFPDDKTFHGKFEYNRIVWYENQSIWYRS